jgi:hypothetical protein
MTDIESVREIWSVLKEYIPAKEKQEAADHLIPLIVDMDFPDSEFQSLVRSDRYLEEAAQEYLDDDWEDDDAIDEW